MKLMKRFAPAMLAMLWLLFAAAPTHAELVSFPAPTGYWSFDRCDASTSWDHAVVNPKAVTLSAGAACVNGGRFGQATQFDGIDDLVTVQNSGALNPGQITVSAWVNQHSRAGVRSIVNKWYGTDAWGLSLDEGRPAFTVVLSSGSYFTARATSPITLNTWTHLTGRYNGSMLEVFVNGTRVASLAATGAIRASNRPIAIGGYPAWNTFHGRIDEVKFYDRSISNAQIQRLAQVPSALTNRGVHLFPSSWACARVPGGNAPPAGCNLDLSDKFVRDLDILNTVGNFNSVKTSVFSYHGDASQSWWMDRQRDRLSHIASATGNHKAWIVRAWPTPADCPGMADYACGHLFAQRLAPVLQHLQTTLRLQHLWIEVANEPNHEGETLFYDLNPGINMARYNDFFRGFYFGQQSVGYSIPLIYAGLTPGCHEHQSECTAEAWYKDYWVRDHISRYAAKVGVHVYWDSTTLNAWNGRHSTKAGAFYQRVRTHLANPGLAPQVPARGIHMTEFNFNRQTQVASTLVQAQQICDWWREARTNTHAFAIEHSSIFVTSTEDGSFQNAYWIADDQLPTFRNCN